MDIFIVDDSPSICMFLSHALELDSHVVNTAGSGEDGLIFLKDHRPDLIIMDVELPGMNGFETVQQIRSNQGADSCPIVYLSSHTEESLIKKGIDSGGDTYLTKPVKLVELKSTIKALERISGVRKQLFRANQTLNSVLSTATEGIYTTNAKGTVLSINKSACEMLELTEQEAIGSNIGMIVGDPELAADESAIKKHLDEVIHNQLGVHREVEFRKKSGTRFPCEASVNFVPDEDDNGDGIFIGIFHDISQRKAYEKELHNNRLELQAMNETLLTLSYRDGLTGIFNRRAFDEAISKELQQAQRDSTPLSVVMCDIDHFKNYNDTYGHQMGDETLIAVASGIADCVQRPSDVVARYGGEEFVLLLPQTDTAGAQLIAERTRNLIAGLEIPNRGSDAHASVTLSLGVATLLPNTKGSPESLIQAADTALYTAKKVGRNNVQLSDS